MPADTDANQRLKELIARIEIEQDPRAFSVLVEELNRLLEGGRQGKCVLLPDPEFPERGFRATLRSTPNYLPSNWPRRRASSHASTGLRPVISLYQAGWNVQAHASLTAPRIIA